MATTSVYLHTDEIKRARQMGEAFQGAGAEPRCCGSVRAYPLAHVVGFRYTAGNKTTVVLVVAAAHAAYMLLAVNRSAVWDASLPEVVKTEPPPPTVRPEHPTKFVGVDAVVSPGVLHALQNADGRELLDPSRALLVHGTSPKNQTAL